MFIINGINKLIDKGKFVSKTLIIVNKYNVILII